MFLSLKSRIIAAVLLIAGLNAELALAQSTKFLTLHEAVDLCIQNNKQLKLSKTKVEAATAYTKEAKDKRLPDLGASGSYVRLTKPTITGPLGQGTTPSINQASIAMVSGSVPLFSGFRIKNGIESAKYLEEATKLDAEGDRDAVVQNTIAAYGNLYKSKSNVELIKENLKQAEVRTADFVNLEQKGVIARNDLLRIQLQESNIRLALMDAESDWKMANLNMNIMIGLPEETTLQLDSTSFVDITNTKTYGEYEQLAFNSRYDIKALSYREKSAITGIKLAKADYLPSLKLTGGYFAANVPNFITITNAWNAGVGVNYNIASLWKTGAKVNSAKIQLAQLKVNQEILNDHVKLEVAQAYENFILSQKKIDVYKQAMEQANENNIITKNKYRNNLVNTTDLLEADIQNLQAEINYANSKADAVVAYKKLLQTSGVLSTK